MDREQVRQDILNLNSNSVLLTLPTSFGKSKIGIDLALKRNPKSILIIVPRLVLIENWKNEFIKWDLESWLDIVTFSTYVGLNKYANTKWDTIIYDECFKGDTEILTDRGYVPFNSLSSKDKVAQFTDTGNIEFVEPLRLIKRRHTGTICKVHLGRNRYVYMTPNHNQVYRTKSRNSEWRVKPIKDLSFNYSNEIPVSGKGTGNNEDISILERVLIAIQADGTLQRHQKNESVYSISVTKERKKERLFTLLKEYGNYTCIKGRIGQDRYIIKVPKGDAKLLSTHFSINMGYNRAKSFINEVLNWDGSYLKGSIRYYSSKIKENADFVAAIAVQAGYKVFQSVEEDNRKDSYSTIYRVFMRENTEAISTQRMSREYIEYDDDVYCVEVPSHKIVVRSEGFTFISGNCHHLTERCIEFINTMDIKYNILLSATVSKNMLYTFKYLFKNLQVYSVKMKEAINNDILPDPKVFLVPLTLDTINADYTIIKHPKATNIIRCSYAERWNYIKNKNIQVHIKCTQYQYVKELNEEIEFWKKRYMITRNEGVKAKWLFLAGQRLKFLSQIKNPILLPLLEKLKSQRVLTFCSSIEQTEVLGKYCINSKNNQSLEYLTKFNTGKIKHITACNMLNEGVNLKNCQVGLYANLNSSEIMIIQKLGRVLRHKDPIIIIPYYKNTREEEIKDKMLEDYNPELIEVTTINDIKL